MVSLGSPLRIIYTNYRGETAERIISPQRAWFGATEWHPEPQWLLTAFDHEKQANRDFAFKDFGYPAPSPRAQAWDSDVIYSAKNLLCSLDPENDLDNPEKFIAWHNLDDAIRAFGTSREPLIQEHSTLEAQSTNEPGAHRERARALEEARRQSFIAGQALKGGE